IDICYIMFFFFQAEDGIRDATVTGVQTCALPISMSTRGKVLLGAGGVVFVIGLVVVSAGARRDRGQEVRFDKVGRRDLVAAVTASGKIQPKKKVDRKSTRLNSSHGSIAYAVFGLK